MADFTLPYYRNGAGMKPMGSLAKPVDLLQLCQGGRQMKRNIFVVALEEQQRKELLTLRHNQDFDVHGLLEIETAVEAKNFSFNDLLNKARQELEQFPGSIDAIVAHWDFPTSVLVPLLCKEYDIPSPSVESVLKCEHKYWSRLEQQKVIPECVPKFCSIDPFADNPMEQVSLEYPFWLKPVKAFSSQLGFKIENSDQYHAAIEEIRNVIPRFGDPFNEALDYVDRPQEIQSRDGNTCIAEEIVSGVQGAPEGTMFQGEFNVHGIVTQPRTTSEAPYDRLVYPSDLPEPVHRRMIDASKEYLEHIGFDNGCFNAEFMWDENSDKLWLIEFNTRISQSHSELFIMVDGISNHEAAIDIALGQRPSLLNRQGSSPVAAKCFIPYDEHKDGVIARIPSGEEIAGIKQRFPGTMIRLDVEPGTRLGELPNQDQFCYHLGTLFIAGENHDQIQERYQACLEMLKFEVEPLQDEPMEES